jgi:hypothetical protein
MSSRQAYQAGSPGHRYVPLQAVTGKRPRGPWAGQKFRPSSSASGAKLRSSIWVRPVRRRSKRVFLCC